MDNFTTSELTDELIRRIENRNAKGATDFRMRMVEWLKRLKRVAEQEGF